MQSVNLKIKLLGIGTYTISNMYYYGIILQPVTRLCRWIALDNMNEWGQ